MASDSGVHRMFEKLGWNSLHCVYIDNRHNMVGSHAWVIRSLSMALRLNLIRNGYCSRTPGRDEHSVWVGLLLFGKRSSAREVDLLSPAPILR